MDLYRKCNAKKKILVFDTIPLDKVLRFENNLLEEAESNPDSQ